MQWVLSLLVVLMTGCSSEPDTDMVTTHATFLTGQSNAWGEGASPPNVSQPSTMPLYSWLLGGYQSTQLDSMAPQDGTHGIELTMAPAVRDAGAKVAAVYKHAKMGASIDDWGTGAQVWLEIEARLPVVSALLLERNPGTVVWHIVWFQGESEAAADPPNGDAYATALRYVLTQLRKPSLCGATARVYIIALNPAFPLPAGGIASIRSAEASVGADTRNVYIETSGISTPGLHYSSAGLNAIGGLVASAIIAATSFQEPRLEIYPRSGGGAATPPAHMRRHR